MAIENEKKKKITRNEKKFLLETVGKKKQKCKNKSIF